MRINRWLAGLLPLIAVGCAANTDAPSETNGSAQSTGHAEQAASRSIQITIVNNTAFGLRRTASGADHGVFDQDPAMYIAPNGQTSFSLESAGILTGAAGQVNYRVDHVAGNIQVQFSNPYIGGNSYTCDPVASNVMCDRAGGGGNDAQVVFTLRTVNSGNDEANTTGIQSVPLSLGGGSWQENPIDVSGTSAVQDGGDLLLFVRDFQGRIAERRQHNGSWGDWINLDGYLTSAPSAVVAGNRLFVFARGGDGAAWYRYTDDRVNWSSWGSMGGSLTSGVSAMVDGGGQLWVFGAGGDNAVWASTSTDGNTFGGWFTLGGSVQAAPSAVWVNGQMNVFAIGSDQQAYRKYFDFSKNAWIDWAPIGGFLTSAPSATMHNGMLKIFARGGDGAVWEKQYNPNNGGWIDWQSRDGYVTSAPAAAAYGSNLVVFARGGDSSTWERQADVNETWQGWQYVGGSL